MGQKFKQRATSQPRPQQQTLDDVEYAQDGTRPPSEATSLLFVSSTPGPSSQTAVAGSSDPVCPNPDHVVLSMGDPDNDAPHERVESERRGRFSWLAVLMLPGRIAVGALSFFAGAGLSKRAGFPRVATLFSGCISVVVGQVLVSAALRAARRRSEEEDMRAAAAHSDQMAWLDAIQAVGKIVDTFSDGLRGPHAMKHIFLDTSLLRLLHDSCSASNLQVATKKPPSPTDALVLGRYYLDYALSTYGYMLLKLLGVMDPSYNFMVEGTRGVDVAQYLLRLRPDQILVSKLDGEGIRAPRHFVAVDEVQKSIVVAIRGTNSISDIITDLLCDNEPFAGGYAHGGMKEAAESLYTAILPTLRSALQDHPSYSIALTGHSLGAGVAILLTKVLLMNGFTDIKCYAIAPCPVFGPMDRVDSDWSDALECFVHAHDLVAKLCLATARNLALEIERIDALQLTVPEKKEIIDSQNTGQLERMLRRHQRVSRDPREKHVEQLYIPTHQGIHWLMPNAKGDPAIRETQAGPREYVGPAYLPSGSYSSYVVRPRLFERMLVTPGCVSAHFPSSYTVAFASLDLPPREVRAPRSSAHDFSKTLWYSNELG